MEIVMCILNVSWPGEPLRSVCILCQSALTYQINGLYFSPKNDCVSDDTCCWSTKVSRILVRMLTQILSLDENFPSCNFLRVFMLLVYHNTVAENDQYWIQTCKTLSVHLWECMQSTTIFITKAYIQVFHRFPKFTLTTRKPQWWKSKSYAAVTEWLGTVMRVV